MKEIIKLGACKGKLLPILREYLYSLGIDIEFLIDSRKAFYRFQKNSYILEVYILRYDDLIKYCDYFDLLLYGVDQVLEKGNDCRIVLKYFDQVNCRLSILKNINSEKKNIDKIATNYVNIASKLLKIDTDRIIELKGSLEVAPYLGISDYILDIVVTGNSALENDLKEERKVLDMGAVLATSNIDMAQKLRKLNLLPQPEKEVIISLEGKNEVEKDLLSKLLLHSRINNNPNILLENLSENNYSGFNIITKDLNRKNKETNIRFFDVDEANINDEFKLISKEVKEYYEKNNK